MNDQELASRGERLGAYLFEVVLALPFCLVSGVLGYRLGVAQLSHLPLAPSLLFALGLSAVCLTALMIVQMYWLATRGQTLGKRWMKIRIVRLDGTDAGFVHAVLWRGFLHMGVYLTLALVFGRVLGYAYLLADILFIFGAKKSCIHDLIAGTKVVRVTDAAPSPVVAPPVAG